MIERACDCGAALLCGVEKDLFTPPCLVALASCIRCLFLVMLLEGDKKSTNVGM